MLLLFETPAGFALFKVHDEGRLEDVDVRSPLLSAVLSNSWQTFRHSPPLAARALLRRGSSLRSTEWYSLSVGGAAVCGPADTVAPAAAAGQP